MVVSDGPDKRGLFGKKFRWLGIPFTAGVFALQIYTASLLGKCWRLATDLEPQMMASKERYPYAALAQFTLGTTTSRCVALLLDITVFSAGIPNILVASQNLQLLGLKMSDYNFDFSYCYWMIIVGVVLCPMMWLGSPKDMKAVSATSVITILLVVVLTWFCIISDTTPLRPWEFPPINHSLWQNLLSGYGIIAFQFDIHPMILTVQVDMQNKNKITTAVIYALLFSSLIFLITLILVSSKYGMAVHHNILQGLPKSLPLYFTVLLVTIQLCFTSAVGNSALYQDVEDYLQIPRVFNGKRCLIRSIIMLFAVLFAEAVPRFDIVMGLIGGTFTGPLMFVLPTLFYIKILSIQKQYRKDTEKNIYSNGYENTSVTNDTSCRLHESSKRIFFDFILPRCVLVIGVIATILATYCTIKDTIEYAEFAPPCLFNFTAASRSLKI